MSGKSDAITRTVVRPALRTDGAGIFDVLASAFRLEEGTSKWQRNRSLAFDGAEQFLVMEIDREVVGTVMISRHWLRVGTAKVLKGDVGEVAILRSLQGRGLGTVLMQECVRYLRENGFHLSRLGGLNRFYARFGYTPFPRRYYEFLLTEVHAGADVISPEKILELPRKMQECVRFYDPSRDWHRRDELYDQFNKDRTGSLVAERAPQADPPQDPPDPNSLRFVYEQNGMVYGYLFAEEYPGEISPFEAKVTIYDCAFDFERPEAFTSLIKYLLREAFRRGSQRVSARLPYDPLIQKLLTDSAIPFSLRELQTAPASNMLLLVNLRALLSAISPELIRRVRGNYVNFSPFSVELQVGDQRASFSVSPQRVSVGDVSAVDATLQTDANSFFRWLFGLNSFSEWQVGVKQTLTKEQELVFSVLFPKEPCASGPWG